MLSIIKNRKLSNLQENLKESDVNLLMFLSLINIFITSLLLGLPYLILFCVLFFFIKHYYVQKVITIFKIFLLPILILILFFSFGNNERMIALGLVSSMTLIKSMEIKNYRDSLGIFFCCLISPFMIVYINDGFIYNILAGTILSFLFFTFISILSESKKNEHIIYFLGKNFIFILALTSILFITVPRKDNPWWGPNQGRTGMSEEMDVSTWSDVLKDYSVAFTVDYAKGRSPSINDLYYKSNVLWNFDGKNWTNKPEKPSVLKKDFNEVKKYKPENVYSYTIRYSMRNEFASPIGNVLFPMQDINVFSDGTVKKSYKTRLLSFIAANEASDEMSEEERLAAIQLPKGFNQRSIDFAKKLRSQFNSDKEYVDHLMNMFSNDYTYTLQPKRFVTDHVVDEFLFDTKEGFCQNYSSAFAVLLRAVGIPTRIVNGYMSIEKDEKRDVFVVRQSDAHAWNEVWLDGKWQRFDPTNQVSVIIERESREQFTLFDGKQFFTKLLAKIGLGVNSLDKKEIDFNELVKEYSLKFIKSKYFYILLILLIPAIIIIYVKTNKYLNSEDRCIKEINKWFDNYNIEKHLSWDRKMDEVKKYLSENQFKILYKEIKEVEEHIFSSRKTNLKQKIKNIKKIKVNK